jgi:hypothetical protein
MLIIDGQRVKSITAQGLLYSNDDGTDTYIDFLACYNNYLQKVTSHEHIERMKELNPGFQWDTESIKDYIKTRTKWREIAKRNVLGPPWDDGPYIEFYTEPPTRIKFATQAEYGAARYVLEGAGWRTFDLS